jgi:hypothetical protein
MAERACGKIDRHNPAGMPRPFSSHICLTSADAGHVGLRAGLLDVAISSGRVPSNCIFLTTQCPDGTNGSAKLHIVADRDRHESVGDEIDRVATGIDTD